MWLTSSVPGQIALCLSRYCFKQLTAFLAVYTSSLIKRIYSTMQCAMHTSDSGGPLVCNHDGRWVVQGIVKAGSRNCNNGTVY